MASLSEDIKHIEQASSGYEIRGYMVNALNTLNNSIEDSKDTFTGIPVDRVKEICTR